MLEINNLSFSYENHKVLNNINMVVEKGETIALIGRSGVGKTTLFQLITGLISPQKGTIRLNGSADYKGKISYMLQKDMLYSHYTVRENIMLPRIIAGNSKYEANELAKDLLEQFGMEMWSNYYPKALSGGMRQRISFLRTAAFRRDWLLLDEAFSALDAFNRANLHKWFMETREVLNWSSIFITHDIDEALILSDRVYILAGQPGSIVYERESNFKKENIDEVIFTPEFIEAKKDLLEVLNQNEKIDE